MSNRQSNFQQPLTDHHEDIQVYKQKLKKLTEDYQKFLTDGTKDPITLARFFVLRRMIEFPFEIEAIAQKHTTTRSEKKAILQAITKGRSQPNPCEMLEQQIKTMQDELVSQESADSQMSIPSSLLDCLASFTSQAPSPAAKTLISKHYYQALKLVDANVLTLVNKDLDDVTSENSASYQAFTELIIESTIRAIVRLNQELSLHAHLHTQRQHMPKVQLILMIMVDGSLGMALQRWLEHDFTEQQWRQLIDAQYAAFDRIVPHVCAIVSAIST